jgi:hypothetical protein
VRQPITPNKPPIASATSALDGARTSESTFQHPNILYYTNKSGSNKPYNAPERNRFSTQTAAVSHPIIPTRDRPAVPRLWGDNVLALIQQDDKVQGHIRLEERARQGVEFRPEIRETFKDKKGAKEVALHEKVASKEKGVQEVKADCKKDGVNGAGVAGNKAEANTLDDPADGGPADHEDPGLRKYVAAAEAVRVKEGDSEEFKCEVAAVEAESGSGTAQIKREEESIGSEYGGGVKIEGK